MKKILVLAFCIVPIILMAGCSGINLDSRVIPVRKTQAPTQVVVNTPTIAPTPQPTQALTQNPTMAPTLIPTGQPDVRESTETFDSGSWKVTLYQGATDQIQGWMKSLKDPDPRNWPNFPNVDNPQVQFEAKNGLEYGLDERNYCPQETCDVVVAAGEFNAVSADYDFGFTECHETNGVGCLITFFNVGEVSANFEQVTVDNGFSVAGRYWNGNELHQAMWGLTSHMTANMLGLPTTLNPVNSTNAGANCSVKLGCNSVLVRIVVTSGNQVLTVAETTVTK